MEADSEGTILCDCGNRPRAEIRERRFQVGFGPSRARHDDNIKTAQWRGERGSCGGELAVRLYRANFRRSSG